MLQNWGKEINKVTEMENFENKRKKIKHKKYPKAGLADKYLKNALLIDN